MCVHSDHTSGHEPDCSITTLVNLYMEQISKKRDDIYFESFKFS